MVVLLNTGTVIETHRRTTIITVIIIKIAKHVFTTIIYSIT
jgi:hypothetical protein